MAESNKRFEEQLTHALENSNHKILIELLFFSKDHELSEIKSVLEQNQWMLPRVCELGFQDILQRIIDLHVVDINAVYLGKTGLQYAAQKGYAKIIAWLLEHGANLQKKLWKEDTELYLATLHGNQEVVEVLSLSRPELVQELDEDERYCLLYAACQGGHLDLVKYWILPTTDVDKKIAFSSNLKMCEKKYPLFAACQGEHFEVAKFLILEKNASITKDICHDFPEFTTRLIRSLFLKSDKKGHHFNLSDRKIECILPCWFSVDGINNINKDKNCKNDNFDKNEDCKNDNFDENEDCKNDNFDEMAFEIMLDVQKNKLQEIPDEVLLALTKLVSLNASHNPHLKIPDAFHSNLLHLNWLKSLNVSHCQLKSVSSHVFTIPCLEELNMSCNGLTELNIRGNTACGRTMECLKLQSLDISYNFFVSLPADLQVFTGVTSFNASHNQLQKACTPWQCPLKHLDLSYNKLTTFASSADQYWGKTLKRLHLQCNHITEIPESIVKMCALSYLDMSSNKIQKMAAPNLWRCPLSYLNLNDNNLGIGEQTPPVELPVSCLASTLMMLFLANNNLAKVPVSISGLVKLYDLDLSNNNKIKNLPLELGTLKNLYKLKAEGICVQDKELQKLLIALNNHTNDMQARTIIDYLERKHRNFVHPKILKIVVLGCKKKDGYCIVQELADSAHVQSVKALDHENMTMNKIISNRNKVTFEIWELPDSKVTSTILPCFLTLNTLYLIVHDVSNCGTDLHLLSEKVSSIQACVPCPQIIIVCIYSGSLCRDKLEREIKVKSHNLFQMAKVVSVTLGNKKSFSCLQQEICTAWESMTDAAFEKKLKLCDRQVPEKFLEVARNIKNLNKSVCRMEEFLIAARCSKKDLKDGADRNLKLHEFLLQVGVMLHYNIGQLSDFVILNPEWLFEVLSKFLKSLIKKNGTKISQLSISKVGDKFLKILPEMDLYLLPAILRLLETFNIGVRLTDNNDEHLLIPSLLSKQSPTFQLDSQRDACKAARLYCLPAIPTALWSHLISQLILAFERFSSSKWDLGQQMSQKAINKKKSFKMSCKTASTKGLHISNKRIEYWKTGISMYYKQGHVVVEEIECNSNTGASKSGILVTVQTTGTASVNDPMGTCFGNKKQLSIIGIVIDQLEDILEMFNPNFRNMEEEYVQIYALCPLCYNIIPERGNISLQGIHFTYKDCAQRLLSKDAIVCPRGPSSLDCLVPELFFMELPSEMHLSAEDIIFTDIRLGHGITGAVTKAKYKGADVAVKIFYDSAARPCLESNNNLQYKNIGDTAQDIKIQEWNVHLEQTKISTAFSDVRREVGILSKLKHEFIIRFIGVCVRPQLLLVMELAPHGSLREELNKRTIRRSQDVGNVGTVISEMLFNKDLTYKIILQIGCALCYLHKYSIIYRDLKPDNILVMSLSLEDRINVKLSDYGISKFNTLQGVTGLFGTVGYMAPEVILKQSYAVKADIYSYAIVMLEILTGLPPPEHLQKPHSLYMNIDTDAKPAHVQGCKIQCNFPYYENLMEECWSLEPDERPSSEDASKRVQSDQFLLLHDSITLDQSGPDKLELTCLYPCQTGGSMKIWLSESGQGSNRFISVYDIESSAFTVYRKFCPGPQIIDMAKVGSKIWVISERLNNLEVIERGNQSNLEICRGVTLEAKATKIINHCYKEDNKFIVLVGLENGSVTMFHFNSSNKKSMTVVTNIELHRDIPIVDMCSLGYNSIAVACGVTIYFLQVELPDTQVNDKGACIPELINSGSISLKNVTDISHPIVSVTADGTALWCCLKNSPYLVKIEMVMNLMKIVLIVTFSWDAVRDNVRLEELNFESQPYCSSRSFTKEEDSPTPDDDVFLKVLSNEPAGEISPVNHNSSAYEYAEHKSPQNNSQEDNDCTKGVYVEIDSKLLSVPESTDISKHRSKTTYDNDAPTLPPRASSDSNLSSMPERTDISEHRSKTTSDTDAPTLPPRASLPKAFSMPRFDKSKPPPIKRRAGYQEVNVHITSLKAANDILLVGTDCGGIILLPLNYSKMSDVPSSPTLPSQLPVLKHPAKKTDHKVRLRSCSSVCSGPSLPVSGSISLLTVANDKFVSLHTSQSQQNCLSERKGSYDKRRGLVLTPEDLHNEEIFLSSTGSTNSSRSLSSSSHNSTATRTGQKQVVDIALWDEITWRRIQTIRSYWPQFDKFDRL